MSELPYAVFALCLIISSRESEKLISANFASLGLHMTVVITIETPIKIPKALF